MAIPKSEWVWMPHPGHFIGASKCQFRLNTRVGNYIISTIGEYRPFRSPEENVSIGWDRFYETMVFHAFATKNECCPWAASDFSELDMEGYKTDVEAYKGHMAMCEKWAKGE